ncbi:MAG: hypothetical protein ACTSQJ_18980 [Promethearchaeota archaeon]
MKPEDHVRRYKQMRATLLELLNKPIENRDNASIVTIAHWASFHLISIIIDQLPIPEHLKHRNHRGIKKSLKHAKVKETIGELSIQILDLYNNIENNFLIKYQYGGINKDLNYDELYQLLKKLETICKKITEKVQNSLAK